MDTTKEIRDVQKKLYEMIEKTRSLTHDEVILISQDLDKMIMKYMKEMDSPKDRE